MELRPSPPPWPGRPRLASALGLTVLGFAQSRTGGSLGFSPLPCLPSPPGRGTRLSTLQDAPSASGRRAARQRSLGAPSPSQLRRHALGAPAMPKCPRGQCTRSPSTAVGGSWGVQPSALFSSSLCNSSQTHQTPGSKSLLAPPSFAELGGAARLQPIPGGTASPGVAKVGPWEAHCVLLLAAGPQALAGHGGAPGGEGR